MSSPEHSSWNVDVPSMLAANTSSYMREAGFASTQRRTTACEGSEVGSESLCYVRILAAYASSYL